MGQTIVREGGLELERRGDLRRTTNGREEADRLIAQAVERRSAAPRPTTSRSTADRRARQAPGPRSASARSTSRSARPIARWFGGLHSRLGQQKRDLERAASQRRQRSCHVVEDRGDQIGKRRRRRARSRPRRFGARERDRSGRFACSTPSSQSTVLPIPGSPERTSARGPSSASVEERLDRVQLLLPPDDSRRHQAPTLSTPTARPARERIPSLR